MNNRDCNWIFDWFYNITSQLVYILANKHLFNRNGITLCKYLRHTYTALNLHQSTSLFTYLFLSDLFAIFFPVIFYWLNFFYVLFYFFIIIFFSVSTFILTFSHHNKSHHSHFFYVFSVLANGIMKLLLHSVGQVKKRKKKKKVETIINTGSWFANFRFSLDALVFHLLYKRYTIAKQSLSIR